MIAKVLNIFNFVKHYTKMFFLANFLFFVCSICSWIWCSRMATLWTQWINLKLNWFKTNFFLLSLSHLNTSHSMALWVKTFAFDSHILSVSFCRTAINDNVLSVCSLKWFDERFKLSRSKLESFMCSFVHYYLPSHLRVKQ